VSIRYPPLPSSSLLNQTSPLKAALEAIICVWFETIAIVPFTYFRTGNVSADAILTTIVMKIALYIGVNRALRIFMLMFLVLRIGGFGCDFVSCCALKNGNLRGKRVEPKATFVD
jgi:hypothetical protein